MLNSWTLAMQESAETVTEAPSEIETGLTAVEDSADGLWSAIMSGDVSGVLDNSEQLMTAVMPILMNLGVGILIILVTLILAGRAKAVVRATTRKAKVDETLSGFFGQLAKWAVMGIGLIAAVGKMGIPTASFAAVIAGASLAIGLAFQGSLGNLASGVMLLVFRPFKVGDVVNAAGITAKVVEISLFTTLFDTVDNRRIIVPNGAIFGSTIENITHHPLRRCDIAVGTAYDADLAKTREVLESVARSVEGGLSDPEPVVYLSELGGSSIDWALRVWCQVGDYWAVRERLTRDTKNALDAAGIGIPFPQMDVHLDGEVVQKTS